MLDCENEENNIQRRETVLEPFKPVESSLDRSSLDDDLLDFHFDKMDSIISDSNLSNTHYVILGYGC